MLHILDQTGADQRSRQETLKIMTDFEKLNLRPCVGIMLLNTESKVWIGKRIGGSHNSDDQHAWQMPQGGIDKGETPIEAAYRELAEETGIKSTELLQTASSWFSYEIPKEIRAKALKGKYQGQTQQWFAMRFKGEESEIDIGAKPGHKAEFNAWKWEDAEKLPDLIIPFKRRVYEQVIEEFSSLLSD